MLTAWSSAGAWCAELLSVGLPSTHRVVLVDRQRLVGGLVNVMRFLPKPWLDRLGRGARGGNQACADCLIYSVITRIHSPDVFSHFNREFTWSGALHPSRPPTPVDPPADAHDRFPPHPPPTVTPPPDVYLFPRASVISSHANKVFVPNTHIFTNPDRGNLNPPPKSTETKPSPPPSPAKVSAALAAAQNGGAAPPHDGSLVDDHPVEETEILGHAHLQGDARIRDCFVHAGVERITPTHVVLDKKLPKEEYDAYNTLEEQVDYLELDDSVTSIKWDYLVYVSA